MEGGEREVTPEQRRRAGREIARRIHEMGGTVTSVAKAAGVDPKTLKRLVDGEHWPSDAVMKRLEAVLRWREGEISAKAVGVTTDIALFGVSDSDLAAELHRRLLDRERRDSRMRAADRRVGNAGPI